MAKTAIFLYTKVYKSNLECYGIKVIPPDDEKWLCQKCEDNAVITQESIVCCTRTDGALKRTNFPKRYVHVVCAWWNPLIDNKIDYFRVENWMLDRHACYICNVKHGLTISCRKPDCSKRFHVMCGVEKGVVPLDSLSEVSNYDIMCEQHTPDAKENPKSKSKLSNKKLSKNIDGHFVPKDVEISSESDSKHESDDSLSEKEKIKIADSSTKKPKLVSDSESSNSKSGHNQTASLIADSKKGINFERFNVRQIMNEPKPHKEIPRPFDIPPAPVPPIQESYKSNRDKGMQIKKRSTGSVENSSQSVANTPRYVASN
jgi:hypothetical protein